MSATVFLQSELHRRGWLQADLAEIIERHPSAISAVLTGGRRITAVMARDLGAAFSVDPRQILEMQNQERLADLVANASFLAKLEGVKQRAAQLSSGGRFTKRRCENCGAVRRVYVGRAPAGGPTPA